MLYYNFKDYEEFKELFVRKTNDGKKIRTNKIVLNTIRHKAWFDREIIRARNHSDGRIKIPTLTEIENDFFDKMGVKRVGLSVNYFALMDKYFCSSKYKIDEYKGICLDGHTESVRYINVERGEVFRMKAGKFFSSIAADSLASVLFPHSVVNYFCGDVLPQMWEAHAMENSKKYECELHVDKNFADIYDSCRCDGNFDSCMVDKGFHEFYLECVDASAAYLTDAEDYIVARAIIFNKVNDDKGNEFRLCERQYSSGDDLTLQRVLVNKLIAGNHIDGYKKIGASCRDAKNFVLNDGTDISDRILTIRCDIPADYDRISYQDSFKYYDDSDNTACNNSCEYYAFELTTTEGHVGKWDEYHERYCEQVTEVHYNGRWATCDSDNLEDFILVDGNYYHEDEVEICDNCDEYYIKEDGNYYSELTGEYYCCENCMKNAENAYKDDYWFFADYDGIYVECEDDVCEFNDSMWSNDICYGYCKRTILEATLKQLVKDGEMFEYEGEYYDRIDEETGLPYGIKAADTVAV